MPVIRKSLKKQDKKEKEGSAKLFHPSRLTWLVAAFLIFLALLIIVPIAHFSLMESTDHLKAGLLAVQAKDYAKAERHLIRAAQTNEARAAFILGSLYLDGKTPDGQKNPAKALKYFEQAATLGLKDGQYMTALLYDRRQDTPENKEKALNWGLLAAAQGDAEALYAVAVWLERGYSGKTEPLIALSMYEQAAARGHKNAMVSLIAIYSDGSDEIPKNLKRASYWRDQLQKTNEGIQKIK